MKKRIFGILIALVFVFAFALAGCDSGDAAEGGEGGSQVQTPGGTQGGSQGGNGGQTSGGGEGGTQGNSQGGNGGQTSGGNQGGTQGGEGETSGGGEGGTQGGEGEEVKRELRNLPADYTYDTDNVEYKISGDGVEIYGRLYFPSDVGLFPVVIMCHGFNGHNTDFPRECERLAQRGYNAYAFDFPGAQSKGKSTGRTENDYSPLTMIEDLVTVIKHFKAQKNVDSSQIFLWGGSQGGFVARLTAADDRVKDDIAALALYFPAFNIPDDWHGAPAQKTDLMGYYINADFINSVQDLDPFAVIPNYKKDVCIVWGTEDALVRRTYIDQAVAAYGAERAKLTVIDGAGHGFSGAALNTAIDTVMAFLEAHTYEMPQA